MRNYVKFFLWVLLFTVSTFLFKFNMFQFPFGRVGSPAFYNFIISVGYVLIWLFISIWAGLKKERIVFAAALTFSSYPFLLILHLAPPYIFDIAYMWFAPLQGFLIFNDLFALILAITQPLLFILGYKAGPKLIKSFKTQGIVISAVLVIYILMSVGSFFYFKSTNYNFSAPPGFPKNIPIVSGQIVSSKVTQYNIAVDIDTTKSIQEVQSFYEEKLGSGIFRKENLFPGIKGMRQYMTTADVKFDEKLAMISIMKKGFQTRVSIVVLFNP